MTNRRPASGPRLPTRTTVMRRNGAKPGNIGFGLHVTGPLHSQPLKPAELGHSTYLEIRRSDMPYFWGIGFIIFLSSKYLPCWAQKDPGS